MYDKAQLKEMINKALCRFDFNGEYERLIEPVRYAVSTGGKRLRPVLTLMTCNMYTDKLSEAVGPAAGIEVFHNFTLVHDDIMDNSSMRRNSQTVQKKWGLNQAILSGDVMAFIANEFFLQLPSDKFKDVFRMFNTTAIQVCKGQQLDMDYEMAEIVMEADYLQMIELKTAVLIAASAGIGAMIAGADEKNIRLLYNFGKNMGLAFQVQDDLLDIWSVDRHFGKAVGGDIVENKKTLPVIKAFETATTSQLQRLKELFTRSAAIDPKEKIEEVTSIFNQLNIKEKVVETANDYMNKALELLDKVEVDKSKKSELKELALSLVGRSS